MKKGGREAAWAEGRKKKRMRDGRHQKKKTEKINNTEKKEEVSTRARKRIMMKRCQTTTNLIHVTSQTYSSLMSGCPSGQRQAIFHR